MTLQQTIVDATDANNVYYGTTNAGYATTDPYWQIYKVSKAGSVTTTAWPIGSGGYPTDAREFTWTQRDHYNYSLTPDTTAPTLSTVTIASDNSTTTLAKVGDTVTLTIVSSEIIQTPTVTIGAGAATVTMGVDELHWTAERVMTSADVNGGVTFSIAFKDIGGKSGVTVIATTDLSAVTFDKTAPTATVTMTSNNADNTWAKTGDVVTLTIVTDEDVQNVVATLDGNAMAVVAGVDDQHWTTTYTMQAGDTEGALAFTLDFDDLAGNPATQITAVTSGTAVTFDKTLPLLSSASRVSDTSIEVTLSELAKASTITKANDGGFTVAETGAPGTTYAVSAIAPGATNDKVVLTVADIGASDLAGVTVTYTAGGNGTVSDRAGNLLATDGTGVVVPAWDVAPTMVSAERLANTTLKVFLSEDADDATITKANDGGFTVEEIGTPATTYAVSAISKSGSNSDQIELTVADVTASAAVGLVVKYTAGGNGTVTDALGNPMATDATGVNISAWA